MATKAGLLATINGFITAVINVTKHRSSMSAVVDEMYATEVIDSNILENYTNSGTLLTYNLKFRKTGNMVILSGNITNPSDRLISNEIVFAFKPTDLKPVTGTSNSSIIKNVISGVTSDLYFDNTFFILQDGIEANSSLAFNNIIYITQP